MSMARKIVIEPHINYDGILSPEERRSILNKIESAFSWLGAEIPEDIEIKGKKIKLNEKIKNLIFKDELTKSESMEIEKLITTLETEGKSLVNLVKVGDISDIKALELSNDICGILRAVHELRELIKKAPKAKALDAKEDLMHKVEDTKRWLKYIEDVK
jgi:hypothetical protein